MRNKMVFKYKKLLQVVTLFMIVCVANGYVFAFITDGNSVSAAQPKDLLAGILKAFDAPSVRVNGNAAQDDMTILSGAEIQTSKNSGATINLRQLGKVELNSETSVKLVFTAERIELQVLNGQATLTTYKNVSGVMTGADRRVLKTDSSLEISSVGNSETAIADAPLPVPPVAAPGLFGMGLWGTAAVAGGVIGGTVLVWVAATAPTDASRSPVSRIQP